VDYEIDYGIGKIRILNDAILASGANISVSFEDNSLFGFQKKSMVGLRADYTFNKNLAIGATYLRLFETPYTPKVNAGDDPLNNRIVGLDINYSNEAPWLTKLADKLPFYSTKQILILKEVSFILMILKGLLRSKTCVNPLSVGN